MIIKSNQIMSVNLAYSGYSGIRLNIGLKNGETYRVDRFVLEDFLQSCDFKVIKKGSMVGGRYPDGKEHITRVKPIRK